MRPEFLVPAVFTPRDVQAALEAAGVKIYQGEINRWTRFEQIMAYDWARRREVVAAGAPKRMLRPKPEFVRKAQLLKPQGQGTALGHAGSKPTAHPDQGLLARARARTR